MHKPELPDCLIRTSSISVRLPLFRYSFCVIFQANVKWRVPFLEPKLLFKLCIGPQNLVMDLTPLNTMLHRLIHRTMAHLLQALWDQIYRRRARRLIGRIWMWIWILGGNKLIRVEDWLIIAVVAISQHCMFVVNAQHKWYRIISESVNSYLKSYLVVHTSALIWKLCNAETCWGENEHLKLYNFCSIME